MPTLIAFLAHSQPETECSHLCNGRNKRYTILGVCFPHFSVSAIKQFRSSVTTTSTLASMNPKHYLFLIVSFWRPQFHCPKSYKAALNSPQRNMHTTIDSQPNAHKSYKSAFAKTNNTEEPTIAQRTATFPAAAVTNHISHTNFFGRHNKFQVDRDKHRPNIYLQLFAV